MTYSRHHLRWSDPEFVNVVLSSGPIRVVTDQPDPDFKPRPVGFTAEIEPPVEEPTP